MYKIFIDTNIFIDFYRINRKDNLKEIIKELPKYQKYLIFTEQSKDEFLRNREKLFLILLVSLKNKKGVLLIILLFLL